MSKADKESFFRRPRSRIRQYCFEAFSFDPEHLELRRSGEVVELRVQPARLLKALLEQAPDIMPRSLLQETIWDDGTMVEFDQGLNVCVNQLRSALGDSATNPKFIETLPKRGYRFLPVVKTEYSHQRSGWLSLAAAAGITMLIAAWSWFGTSNSGLESPVKIYVAPVQVEGAELSSFHGIAQYALRLGTIDRLMNSDLDVLTTINGVTLWKDIDQNQPAVFDYTLFMTLSPLDRRGYSLDAIVVGPQAGQKFSKKTFHTTQLDADSLSELSAEIALWSGALFGLDANAERAGYGHHQPAYFDAMVKAKRAFQLADRKSLADSLRWFDEALAANPDSIDAKGGKSLTLAVLSGNPGFPVSATYQQALTLADEIRGAVGATAQSELTRGFIFLYRDWDLARAHQAFDLALELAPGDALVHSWRASVLAAQGEVQAAAKAADKAVELDPLSMAINGDRCWYLSAAGRNEEAVNACELALEIDPGHYWSRIGLVIALEELQRNQQALDALVPVVKTLRVRSGLTADSAEVAPGSLTEAHCEIADLLNSMVEDGQFPLFQAAAFNVRCGRYEQAAVLLEEANRGGESGALFYQIDPRFREFRSTQAAKQIDMRVSSR